MISPDHCVLISAAAGGLGKAFAAECASRGWNLFLTDIRADALEPLAVGLQRLYGAQVSYFACDLADPAGREALWQEIERRGLRFDFLINIAGMEYEGPFAERSAAEVRALLRLNMEATVEMTLRVLHFRIPGQPLFIINVSSLAGFYPMPIKALYAASKRFLLDFSLALREELRPAGVRVMALCPAGLPTNPRSIRRMAAQGWLGELTRMEVGTVAARSVTLALAGRAVYVPGFLNQAAAFFSRLLPPTWAAAWIGRRWRAAYRRGQG